MTTKNLTLALIIAATLISAPFLFTLAGDAQVHLAVAENFIKGHPFQYNPQGEIILASTSPFWTMLLVLFYWTAGHLTPLLLKITTVAIWITTAYLLHRISQRHWQFSTRLSLAIVGLWLTHTIVVANSLSGLENVLTALQITLLYFVTIETNAPLTPQRNALIGALLGWTILTRPDGGLFAFTLLTIFLLQIIAPKNGSVTNTIKKMLPVIAIIGVVALLILLPWYFYQAAITGKFVTDSSLSRLYMGRQSSFILIPNRLYFHPKATISLMTGFLPLLVGFAALTIDLLTQIKKRRDWSRKLYPQTTAVSLLIVGYLFYSFGVGAESFGRYFLPLYPFLFLTGVDGLQKVHNWLRVRQKAIAQAFAISTILFFVAISGFDYYRRLGPGRFEQNHILDVIYGPANLQYYSANLFALISAPEQRIKLTDEFLLSLGAHHQKQTSIAVTEVQLRYFLDGRVDIISLDGRTSANIINYFNKTNGVPDFAHYFGDLRPDFVHVNQWCQVGGWLATVRPAAIQENLVCQWQRQISSMTVGEQFIWESHTVTLVAPEIVHIAWND